MPPIPRRSLSLLTTFLLLSCVPTVADDKPTQKEISDYELMSVFVEAFEQIESNYVKEVDRRELLEAAVNGMVSHLDQYSNFIPPRRVSQFNQMMEQEFGGIGIQVNAISGRLIVVSPLPGTPAFRAGIQSGDIITEVEGTKMRGVSLSGAVDLLQGPIGRPVKIKVLHPGNKQAEEMTLVRQLIKAPTVRGDHYRKDATWEYMLSGEPRIGYLRVSHFSRHTGDELKVAVDQLMKEDMQGLVIDMRNNPGGLLEVAIEMCDMFLEEGNIVSVRGRNVAERSWDAKKTGAYPKFPLAVVVNNFSASASEVFSACMQDNERAVVIGERTWGKGSVQNVIRMEAGDSALKLTTASYHRPSGVNIHRFPDMNPEDKWGVTPDDGFMIALTRDERDALARQQRARDILKRNDDATETSDDAAKEDPEAETTAAAEETVEDRQLQAAVGYIKEQLQGPKVAEAPVKDETEKPVAEPEQATPAKDSTE
jgi:carboxyl-terminal processing protease